MPASINPATSERLIKFSESSVKDLLIDAYDRYKKAFDKGDMLDQRYWDGYIRALHRACEIGGIA